MAQKRACSATFILAQGEDHRGRAIEVVSKPIAKRAKMDGLMDGLHGIACLLDGMDGKVPLASITMLAVPTNASQNDKEQQDHSLPFSFIRISRLYRKESRPTTHSWRLLFYGENV